MTDDIRLPPLPEAEMRESYDHYYGPDQIRNYARAAVLADREAHHEFSAEYRRELQSEIMRLKEERNRSGMLARSECIAQMKKLENPSTMAEIAVSLHDLGRRMNAIGSAMHYFGGFNARMLNRGADLCINGDIVAEWANEIEKEAG